MLKIIELKPQHSYQSLAAPGIEASTPDDAKYFTIGKIFCGNGVLRKARLGAKKNFQKI
jgi:hypothetical protein